MNAKKKAVMIVALLLIGAVIVAYAAPALAQMNGTTDQTQARDRDQLHDRTCDCDCLQVQNQTRTQQRLQQYAQNQTGAGSATGSFQYRCRFASQIGLLA